MPTQSGGMLCTTPTMATSETESADETADTDAEDRIEYAWASQTPHTRIRGTRKGIIYAGRLDDTLEQNDSSFGIIVEDPEVVEGTLWVNQEKADDGTTADGVDDDQPRPTDYRIADPDDRDTTIANGALVTNENGPNTYDEADGFEEDTVVIWYNGLTGQRLSRLLDFNGRPYSRWVQNDDGSYYLIKGLYQAADGWRENPDDRGRMAQNGKAPRCVRAPILRDRVEIEYDDDGNVEDATLHDADEIEGTETLIDMSRAQSGRGYRLHAFDAAEFADEFGNHSAEIPRNDSGYVKNDIESELDMPYTTAADEILEQAGYRMHMFTGDGWQDEPDNWSPQSTSEVGTFGISTDDGADDADGLTAKQEQFVREVVDEVSGSGMTPEEMFEGGLAGLVGKYSGQFDRVPDVDVVREEVYQRVAHLDTDDLDE